MQSLLLLTVIAIFTSCAGPTNPFGGDVLISEEFELSDKISHHHVDITMSPDRQYYNSPYDLSIKISDPNHTRANFRYEIVYNNKILNRWLKSEEIVFPKRKTDPVQINFKNLSLLPGNINKISFLYYPNGSEIPLVHTLEIPECLKELAQVDLNISPFKINEDLKNNIVNISAKYQYNPSLIAGLIAQESSFNTHALSVARALGLTQVTPVAHREIARVKEDWEIYPKFAKLPFLNLKYRLRTQLINDQNDWRLDPKKSIEGGILYLDYLTKYWNAEEKVQLLGDVFQDNVPMTDILLASYNSGAYRVKKSIMTNKENWLFDKSLNEARKYVMNIKSYCYAFKQGKNDEK